MIIIIFGVSHQDTEYESALKVNPGQENSPTARASIRTRNLSITSLALYQHAIPALIQRPFHPPPTPHPPPPVLLQWHVKDHGHSAKSAGQVTPKHEWADYAAVQAQCGNLSGNMLTCNSSGNTQPQLSQLTEPLWTVPDVKNEISVRDLISTLKKKKKKKTEAQVGNELLNILACKERATTTISVEALRTTRIQGYLFANDIKMCTEICLGDVTIIQKTNSTQQLQV